MNFGCNVSYELLELLKEQPDLCDYIKIGDFGATRPLVDEAFTYKPLLLHGFGWYERGGMPDFDEVDFDYMARRLSQFGTPYLGMHAVAFDDDVLKTGNIMDHMVRVFGVFSERIPCELLIENMDHSLHYDYKTTVKETVTSEFYTELLERTGLNLLLDTSHAFVSSYQLGMDIYEYLDRMPLHKVREIHFSGSYYDDEKGFMDRHLILNDRDIKVADYLAKNKKLTDSRCLDMITLEYGTIAHADKEAIRHQMNNLKEIFRYL